MDPLAEKYFSISPYYYVADDPVKNLDPDGKRLIFAPGTSQEFKNKFAQAVKFMNAHHTSGGIARIKASNKTYYIGETKGNVNTFDPKSQTVEWNPNLAKITTNDVALSPATLMGH